jgi:hypothetical protein
VAKRILLKCRFGYKNSGFSLTFTSCTILICEKVQKFWPCSVHLWWMMNQQWQTRTPATDYQACQPYTLLQIRYQDIQLQVSSSDTKLANHTLSCTSDTRTYNSRLLAQIQRLPNLNSRCSDNNQLCYTDSWSSWVNLYWASESHI